MKRISKLKNRNGKEYGYCVRFYENKRCVRYKGFTKKDYQGSLQNALEKAMKWRGEQEKILDDEKKLMETRQYQIWRLKMSNKLGYSVEIIHITEKALLVYNGSENRKWLPLSEVEVIDGDIEKGETVVIQIPEWLAVEKGFE